jgi:hypothetical protein
MTDAPSADELQNALTADNIPPATASIVAQNAQLWTEEEANRALPSIYVERRANGVTTVTSFRFKNLAVNWKEVIFAIAPVIVVSFFGEPVSAVLEGIRALSTIGGLTNIPMGDVEAKITLYLWSKERDATEVAQADVLSAFSDIDDRRLADALRRLATLGVIKVSDNRQIITKAETIVFL